MKLTYQQKLEALSYRFYHQGTWTPAAGDFYTTSRADLELYQIVAIESGLVTTRYTEGTNTISTWPEAEFLTGGFGPKRVFVPPWVMQMNTGDVPAGNERSPSQQNRTDALINLEEVRKAVFGDVGDEPNVYADYDHCSELAGKMRKAIVELTPAPVSHLVGPQCCMCGKKNLSTVEGDGGKECELNDGRWVCSAECWDRAVEQAPDENLAGHVDKALAWDAAQASFQKGYKKGKAEAKDEVIALRAALKGLVDDLEMRAANGVVNCSDGVYCKARAALTTEGQPDA